MENSKINQLSENDCHRYRQLTDAACKALLGDKLILACILKECVQEFKTCHVHEIETQFIEGEPEISATGVHPETTNSKEHPHASKIHGINGESTSDTEGKVTFDIRFYAITPSHDHVKLIINIEAQNVFYPGYPIIKRAFYYGCRQISAQYGSEFEKAEYENIKKVYSIWICFNPPLSRHNTINMYRMTETPMVGEIHEEEEKYDLMRIIMICLGTSKDDRYTGLLKLLDVFLSNNTDMKTRSAVLMSEFNAEMPTRLKEKEENMCNYSDFVEMRGRNQGMVQGRNQGKIEGKAEAIIQVMRNFKLSMEDAMRGLSIPEDEWDSYRKIILQHNANPSP